VNRITAIFFVSLLALSQYVKQAVYLECRLSNAFKSFAVRCDCEKKAGLEKPVTGDAPLSMPHSHTHLDELFPIPAAFDPDLPDIVVTNNYFPSSAEGDCEGCHSTPFQPPKYS
jgi:hypothetical protein